MLFVAVEHGNAECVGLACLETRDAIHRPGALESSLERSVWLGGPGGLPVGSPCAWTTALSTSRTISSDNSRDWGITPSFAFLCEPQANGVAECFVRTLKEQAIFGRIFRDVEELRRAVGSFVEAYNEQWLPEKNRGHSPRGLRRRWLAAENTAAA